MMIYIIKLIFIEFFSFKIYRKNNNRIEINFPFIKTSMKIYIKSSNKYKCQ